MVRPRGRRRLDGRIVGITGRYGLRGGGQARLLGRQLGEPGLDELGQLGQLRRLGTLSAAAGHRHHDAPLAHEEDEPADLARLRPEGAVAHLVRGVRAGQRGHQLVVLNLRGRRAEPPDPQTDVEALGLAERLEVPAVVELGRRQIGQLAVLELPDVAGDAPDFVVAEQLRDIEQRQPDLRRRLRFRAARERQVLTVQLQRRRLQLPGGRQAHLGAASQKHQVGRVEVGRLPTIELHPIAPLAEVAPRSLAGEHPIAPPPDVPAVVNDQREAADAGRCPLGQIVEPRDRVAAVGPGLHHHLARARRRVKADAVFERPGGRDGGAGDRTIQIGVDDDAVVGSQQIGGTDRIGADREGRPLDERAAGGRGHDRCQQHEPADRRRAGHRIGHRTGHRIGHRIGLGEGAPRIDRSGGCCYLLTHLGIAGRRRRVW